jgi:pyruvate/2-oxoglutarate/acetoin dehydrogenase E1 component
VSGQAAGVISYSQAFRSGVREEMERDRRVFVLGTDLYERGGHFAQVKGLGPVFGADRIRDAPISEAAMVAAGVGAALYGLRPLIDLNFADFAFGAMDEIVNQAAKIRYMFGHPVPLVIRATAGAAAGGAQHQNAIESWFVHTPGLAVVAPSTAYDAKGLIKSALRADDPVIFLMHKRLTGVRGEAGGPEDLVPIGSAAIRRPGDRCTLVGYGATVRLCLEAADQLAADGIAAEVIDLRSLYPLDLATVVDSVKKTGVAVVADEAPMACSIGSEVAATISEAAFDYLDAPVARVHGVRVPMPNSPVLMEAALPHVADVLAAARRGLSHAA